MAMRPPMPVPAISRRARLVLTAIAVFIVLLSVLGSTVSLYVDWLWYGEVQFRSVFTTVLWTRVLLFLGFGILLAVVVAANLVVAYRLRPPFRPMSLEQQNLERYRAAIEPRRAPVLIAVSLLFGVFAGLAAQSRWQTWLLWRNGTSFGVTDPQFHRDIAYFAFTYPFQRFVLGVLFAAVVFSLLGAVAVHYLFGGLRLQTPGEKVTPAARVHLSVLLGVFVLLKAVAYYLDRYGLAFSDRGGITGASYTDVNAVLPAKTILMIIAVICALAFFANVAFRNFQLPAIALVLLVLSSVLIGGAYPALIQQFQVKPNADQKEKAYIGRNIVATRTAYGLDGVSYTDYPAVSTVSGEAGQKVKADKATIPNARLMDPNVLALTFDQTQKNLSVYNFADKLDIDRYTIGGQTQEYVVGVREMDPKQLRGNQTNWINQHLVYTHGNGFVAAPTNTEVSGQPAYVDPAIFSISQPRVYYGELLGDTYSIVGKTADQSAREFDSLKESEDVKYTYDGTGGVSIGNFADRLVFAWYYRERNILFSNAIGPESKIQFLRDPRDRVAKAAPFLTPDGDPYPAVVDGKIKWIVDCYTTLDGYPYSEHTELGAVTTDSLTGTGTVRQANTEVNYIRNSVKAVVDAYTGAVTLYQFGPDDAVLQSWMKAFPGMVKPASEISSSLRQHFRYPEDLFKVQRDLLSRYHVSDPVQFFNSQGFWDVPADPTRDSQEPQPPYFLLAQTPGQEAATFQLTSALNQYQRQNMAAYVTVSSDPADYGKFRVLRLPNDTVILGPTQMFSNFTSTVQIKTEITQLNQVGSKVIYGNLLTLPVGGGLMYVMPVYVQGGGSGTFPLLRKVIVAFGNKVGYEPTLAAALDDVFGQGTGQTRPTPPGPTGPTGPSTGSTNPELAAAIADISKALEHLRSATQRGDFVGIGQAQQELSDATARFEKASASSGGTPSTSTPTPAPSPTS
ncbi:MAG: UPF0182 family protein [Actinobacteria bacterium]|nr:UPF0182 family protein [Actinomycetota bacterium]MBI3688572.1 UPF0182 family protein [Actinomycetota bacterium]